MEALIAIILIITIIAIIISLLMMLLSWLTHLSMVKDSSSIYGKGTYKKFVCQFEKNDLKHFVNSKYAFINRLSNSKFHASIIEFNGIGMYLGFIDWFRAKLYVRKVYKEIFENYKW